MVGKIFRQSEGIQMGTDPGPQIANGYLFGLERQWSTQKYKERQFDVLSRFKMVSRFIDDLKAFNSRRAIGEKRQRSTDRYSSRGVQKKTGQELTSLTWTCSSPEAWFMSECTTRGTPSVRVGPNTLPSNVDEKQPHASLIGQLVRFEKLCSKVELFTERAQKIQLSPDMEKFS